MASFYSQPTHWLRLRVDLLGLCCDMEHTGGSGVSQYTFVYVCLFVFVCEWGEKAEIQLLNELWRWRQKVKARSSLFYFSTVCKS